MNYLLHLILKFILSYTFVLLQDKEFIDDSPKSRSEFSKDKNDEINDKELNNKYLLPRLQKQFENSDATNKLQNVSSTSMQILIKKNKINEIEFKFV